jgi:hypothetical protein
MNDGEGRRALRLPRLNDLSAHPCKLYIIYYIYKLFLRVVADSARITPMKTVDRSRPVSRRRSTGPLRTR